MHPHCLYIRAYGSSKIGIADVRCDKRFKNTGMNAQGEQTLLFNKVFDNFNFLPFVSNVPTIAIVFTQ